MRRSKHDAEQTRTAILDAAESLFVRQGVAATSLDRISRSAGVTRGAFYWHFKDKVDLLRSLRERATPPHKKVVAQAAETGHDDPLGLLETSGAQFLTTFEMDERQQRLFRIFFRAYAGDEGSLELAEADSEMCHVLLRLAEQARDNGTLNRDFTPEEAAATLMVTMNGVLNEWLRSGRAFPLAQFGGKLLRMQTQMLREGQRARPAG